jgi:hypothetical protein
LLDRIRALVNPDLSRKGARLFEPTLDRLQRVHQGSTRLAAKLELNLAIRPERNALAAHEANQINDEKLRALNILCRNSDDHSRPSLWRCGRHRPDSAANLRSEERDI